jgi:hypothetical protein
MMILYSPLFLLGAIILANTSDDSITRIDVVSSYIMFSLAAVVFLAGAVLWIRHR